MPALCGHITLVPMHTHTKPVILSCSGPVLLEQEAAFFKGFHPFGFIFFGRNIVDPDQFKKLCADVRASVGWHCPILIDQEGGRVRRMRPPHWPDYPSMKEMGDKNDVGILQTVIRGIAADLNDVGIDVDCAPVLDVLFTGTHAAIGDRAFSDNPDIVGHLGRVVAETFIECGITPVMKHMPGQGRSSLDSHYDLPVVAASMTELESVDFKPFLMVMESPKSAHIWGMVSHIVYTAIDDVHPASTSHKVVDVIRNALGFNGLLVSDDLCMNALSCYGGPADRVVKTLEAGMDIALYCAGHLNEMEDIAKACPPLRQESLNRYNAGRLG